MGSLRLAAVIAGASLLVLGHQPVEAAPTPNLHPGAAIVVEGGGACSLGFLFRGSDGHRYMSTAGHCVIPVGSGSTRWQPGRGPAVRLEAAASALVPALSTGTARVVGRVVYAVQELDGDDDRDFALIRLAPDVVPDPKVPHFGGPIGINATLRPEPAVVNVYGQALAISTVAPARSLVAQSLSQPHFTYANGPSGPGDSGAPVLDASGMAIGSLLGAGGNGVQTGPSGVREPHEGGAIRIGRLRPVMDSSAKAMGIRLVLATAPASKE